MSISQVDEEIKRRKMDPDFSSVYINHRSFKAINTIQGGFKVGEMSVIARGVIFSGFCQNLVIFYSKSYTCQKKVILGDFWVKNLILGHFWAFS